MRSWIGDTDQEGGTLFAISLLMQTTSPPSLPSTRWEAAVSQLHDARRLETAGDLLNAELLCRESLAVFLEDAPEIPEVVQAWMLLAELRFTDGDLEEARLALRKALYRLVSVPHLDEAGQRMQVQALQRLGLIHALRGEQEEARPILRQALLRARRQLGVHAPEVADCLNALAFSSRRAGKYDLAASQLREALRSSGQGGPMLAAQLHRNLARLELERGRPERGEPHARMALALLQREGESVGALQLLLGELLLARGLEEEGERLLLSALPELTPEERRDACAALTRIARLPEQADGRAFAAPLR